MNHRRPLLGLLTLTLFIAGCGPVIPLDAGIKSVGYNVFFGTGVLAPPAPGITFTPPQSSGGGGGGQNFPGANIPTFAPPTAAVVVAPPCPAASPLAFPAVPADITGPKRIPAAARYVFRVQGTQKRGGTVAKYPAAEVREISDIRPPVATDPTGQYEFTVTETAGAYTTATTYRVQPNGDAGAGGGVNGGPAGTAADEGAGIYIVRFTSSELGTFAPTGPGVEIMAFPAVPSNKYQGSGTDPVNQTSMSLYPPSSPPVGGLPVSPPTPPPAPSPAPPPGSVTMGEQKVNACGTVVDSVQNEIRGTFVNNLTHTQSEFDYTFSVATQYGAIIVGDHLIEKGTDPLTGETVTTDITSIIDVLPKT